MEIQFGERVGHGDGLIGAKLFRPEACVSGRVKTFTKPYKQVVAFCGKHPIADH